MNKKITPISINTEYITLGQFLKLADIIQSGGEAKSYLKENFPKVNNETDNRRGRKLRNNDLVEIDGELFEIVQK